MPDLPDDAAVAREPSTALAMLGNALYNLRQRRQPWTVEELERCLEHIEAAVSADLTRVHTAERTIADARVAEEREACARVVDCRADNVRQANTHRGKINMHGEYGAGLLDSAAKAIRALAQPAGQEMEEPSKIVLHTLTDEEQAARMAALEDARLRERAADIRADADERRKRLRRALADPRPGEPEGERR